MICSSCRKQKNEIFVKYSKLIPEMKMLLCQTCINEGKEPRYIIILAGRAFGLRKIIDYIENNKYCGDEIKISELV